MTLLIELGNGRVSWGFADRHEFHSSVSIRRAVVAVSAGYMASGTPRY
jgi:hypothetical protein